MIQPEVAAHVQGSLSALPRILGAPYQYLNVCSHVLDVAYDFAHEQANDCGP